MDCHPEPIEIHTICVEKLKSFLIMLTLGGPVLARKHNDKPINLIYIDHRCYESPEWASQDSGQDSRGHRQRRERLAVLDARQSDGRPRRLGPNPGRLASSARTPNRLAGSAAHMALHVAPHGVHVFSTRPRRPQMPFFIDIIFPSQLLVLLDGSMSCTRAIDVAT